MSLLLTLVGALVISTADKDEVAQVLIGVAVMWAANPLERPRR